MEKVISQAQITKAVINILKEEGVNFSGKKIGISFSIDKTNGTGLTAKVTLKDKELAAVPAVNQVADPVKEAPPFESDAPTTTPAVSGTSQVKNVFQEHAERSALRAGQTMDEEGRIVDPDPEPKPGADGEVSLADPQKLDTQRPKKSLFGN